VARAPKDLKAFARVFIQAGESRSVTVEIPAVDISYYDEYLQKFVVEPTEYEVFVGSRVFNPYRQV
jgi:beta-glucosidase